MRHANKLPDIETVYILGAGASHSVTRQSNTISNKQAPLDNDFCKTIIELNVAKPKWVNESVSFIRNAWKDHQPMSSYGLEQAIIHQLGHMEFIDAIHARRSQGNVSKRDYLNNLAHLICFVLSKAKEGGKTPYERFVRHAFPKIALAKQNNRIITFNYDCLLEKHLLARFPAQAVYFDRLRDSRDAADRRMERYSDPLVVKLHGSSNWHVTTDDYERIINGGYDPLDPKRHFIEKVWIDSNFKPSPKDDVSPLIIPPLSNKPITRIELFAFLWTRAYEYLFKAKEIVVCGYSLPQTDNLANSLFSNFKNSRLERVTVIDPNPRIIERWRSLFARKGLSKCKWSYSPDFQEYVEELDS